MALMNPDKIEITFMKVFVLEFAVLAAIFVLLKIV
jgi:hypothetical protein